MPQAQTGQGLVQDGGQPAPGPPASSATIPATNAPNPEGQLAHDPAQAGRAPLMMVPPRFAQDPHLERGLNCNW